MWSDSGFLDISKRKPISYSDALKVKYEVKREVKDGFKVWAQATERGELPFAGKERSSISDIIIFQHAYYKLKWRIKDIIVGISSLFESCRPEISIWESSANRKYLNS